MQFKGRLDPATADRISACDTRLTDPKRLAALERTGLMDSRHEAIFDRLAETASRLLKAPLTIISLVSDKTQFFKAGYGLPKPYDELRHIPIGESICRYTLTGRDIIAGDAATDLLLMHHPTTEPWGIGAFIASPMTTADGHTLGAFCAVDTKARIWTDDDIMILRELTRSVMAEIELRTQLKELEAERSLREKFVAALSHDLRTPLNVVKMAAKILLDAGVSAEEHNEVARMIEENVNRADGMIRDLLDVTLLKAGQPIRLSLNKVDLSQIVSATVQDLTHLHGSRFKTQFKGSAIGVWDETALRRILDNLLGNAIKYGASSQPVTLKVTELTDAVEVTVHNEGEPISAESIKTLFDPFRRSDDAVAGNQRGWGLGLALVRGFTEAHGGTVEVQSSLEAGTTFAIRLPRAITG